MYLLVKLVLVLLLCTLLHLKKKIDGCSWIINMRYYFEHYLIIYSS